MFFCTKGEHEQHDLTCFHYTDRRYTRGSVRKLFETPSSLFNKAYIQLSNEEMVEQCLALVRAMIEVSDVQTRESLMFILEEKLLSLATCFN